MDQMGESSLAAVLRETHEEVGITSSQVDILGQIGPPQLSLRGMRVWPYVVSVLHSTRTQTLILNHILFQGFVRPTPTPMLAEKNKDSDPLPSLSLSSLQISQSEVAQVFHLPFSHLISLAHLRTHLFRGNSPYWAITVSDLVDPIWIPEKESSVIDEVGGGRAGRLEVWGLTGWYLNLLMKALEMYKAPEAHS